MDKPKYSAQAKHISENYASFKFNLKPEKLNEFKEKCKNNGTTATTEIKKFITLYCENN